VVFAVIAVFVCVWLLFVAPIFQEKENLARSENAALAKDIAEIESMNGNTTELENRMAEIEDYLSSKYASRADTADDAAARIEGICAGLGYRASKISVAQETMLYPAGVHTPALYSVDITFLIAGTEEVGASIIRGIEKTTTADFEITSFVYRATFPEDAEAAYYGEWIFTVTLYYYE